MTTGKGLEYETQLNVVQTEVRSDSRVSTAHQDDC
jgi:hypothetical protein